MLTLRQCWYALWIGQGLLVPVAVLELLLRAWQEPWRHYHTLRHLRECLQALERHAGLVDDYFVVALALWFHDAIYVPQQGDNEARSAELARACLADTGLSPERIEQVARLILATATHGVPRSGDEAVMLDVDLGILAADAARFVAYERQIRAEYAWAPWPLYRAKRMEVLQHFLDRPAVYATPTFQALHEATARANLTQAIATLAAQVEEPPTVH